MTLVGKQNIYVRPSMSNLQAAVWASVVVSIYQDCKIDSRLNARGEV